MKKLPKGAKILLALFMTKFALGATQLTGPESVGGSRTHPEVGLKGMVVSDDRIASEWGAEILRRGGNAIDAAVGTAFALAVTRPNFASLGGGGFLLYCPKGSPCTVLDYREQAPALATPELYQGASKTSYRYGNPIQNGPLASGIPGAVAGLLQALEEFGTIPRKKLLSFPIELAKKGFKWSPHLEQAAARRWHRMNPESRKLFGQKDVPYAPGTLVKQPDLAKILERISSSGKKGFYEGPTAQALVKGLKAEGGIFSAKDLKSYQVKARKPLTGFFKGWEVVTMPPPSSGGTLLLQLLGYAQRADQAGAFHSGYGSAESIHAILHGMSLAFADRSRHFGDPDYVKVPVKELLSPAYLDSQWKSFDPKRARLPDRPGNPGGLPESKHTTHISVMDRFGNAVSLTTTVNDHFGSGFVPPGTGIVMNGIMDDFSLAAGQPNSFGLIEGESNVIAPGKRPLSCMTPTLARNKSSTIVLGAAGGPRIITSVFLSLLNRIQFGLLLPDAIAAARVHHQWRPQSVLMENHGFSPEVQAALIQKGYVLDASITSLGRVFGLEQLEDQRIWGVADLRSEGLAVAE